MLLVLVPLVTASLGQCGIVAAVATTKVPGGLGFPLDVGLDHLLAGGVLGGDVQELPRNVWVFVLLSVRRKVRKRTEVPL